MEFLKNKGVLLGLGAVLLFGGGYAFGRYAAPDKVVVTEKVVEVVKEVVVEKVRTEVKVVRLEDTKTKRRIDELERTFVDGTKERRVITDENIDSVVHDTTVQFIEKDVTKEVERLLASERVKLIERSRPNWRLGLLAGANIPSANPGLDIGLSGRVVVGLEAERRIIGPVHLGVWGLTSGQAGLKLGVDF